MGHEPDAKEMIDALCACSPHIERLGPGQLKVELDSLLESSLLALAAVGGVGLLLLVFMHLDARSGPMPAWTFATALALLVLGGGAYATADDYYIVDLERFEILFHRKVLSYETVSTVAAFDRIAGVAVDGKKQSSKHSTWWEYTILLILKDGRRLRISDPARDDNRRQNQVAAHLAEVLDVHFWPGIREHWLRVRRDRATGEVRVTHEEGLTRAGLVSVILLGLVLVAVVGAGAYALVFLLLH